MKLDAALTAVEVTEAEVDILYQSVNQVEISLEGYPSQPCEAFICGLNPGEKGRVYAAISLMEDKKFLIYTAGNFGQDRGRYDAGIQTALDFLEPIGFQLKEINLNYSAAMRQVILKGIPGIALPGSVKPEWKQRLEKVVASQEEVVEAVAKEVAKKALKPQVSIPAPPEKKPLQSPTPATPPPSEKKPEPIQAPAAPPPTEKSVTTEPVGKSRGGDDVSAMLRVEMARLQDELEAAKEQTQRFKLRIGNLEAELGSERNKSATLAQELQEEQQTREDARSEAAGTIASLEKERDDLAKQVASAEEKAAARQSSLEKEVERLRAEKERAEQQLAEAAGEHSRLLAEAEQQLAEVQASFVQELKEVEDVLAEALEARSRSEERCADLEADREAELAQLASRIEEAEVRGDLRLREHHQATAERLAVVRRVVDSLWEYVGDEALPAGDELLQLLASPSSQPARRSSLRAPVAEKAPAMAAAAPPRGEAAAERASVATAVVASEDSAEAPAPIAVAVTKAEAVVQPIPPVAPPVKAPQPPPKEEPAATQEDILPAPPMEKAAASPAAAEEPEPAREDAVAAPAPRMEKEQPAQPVTEKDVASLMFPREASSATVGFSSAPAPSAGASGPPPAWGRPAAPPEQVESFTSFDLSGGFGGESATSFMLDESLSGLTIAAGSLLEVHRSANFQRFAPMGGVPEEGRAYVCAFEENGASRVVAILEMTKDLRLYVYAPGDPGLELPVLVRSALTFVEDIGFFMLEESLPETVDDRRSAMEEWARFLRWDD